MEFAEFCLERIKTVEKILKEEEVQYDKWGQPESKIELSFSKLSDMYIKTSENKRLHELDTDLVDSDEEDAHNVIRASSKLEYKNDLNRTVDKKKGVNSTQEIKSIHLKRTESKKIKKNQGAANYSVQDSREDTVGSDESSIDDSNMEMGKKSHASRENLPREILKGHLGDVDHEEVVEPAKKQTQPSEALDNTNKNQSQVKFKFGQLKLEDHHLSGVLECLEKNAIFRGSLELSEQNLSDQTLLKLSKIIEYATPQIIELDLHGNTRFGTQGISELAESLAINQSIEILNLGEVVTGFEGEW